MKYPLYLFLAVILLIAIGATVYVFMYSSEQASDTPGDVNVGAGPDTSFPDTSTPAPPRGETGTRAPSTVFLGSEEDDASYVIKYLESDKSYSLSLFETPLGKTRKSAERALLEKLGIGEAEACNLNYQVRTPMWVSQVYAGRDLRFSFCPDVIPLPDI